jgi:2-polyprenylphenol 6-hydroxylase
MSAVSPKNSPDVIVLGSGIVSRACALALAHTGLKVSLLGAEATAASKAELFDPRVFALNASSRSLLQSLKVWDALPQARITAVERMVIDNFGLPVSFDAYEAKFDALAWIVESRELLAALEAAVKFHPLITRGAAVDEIKTTELGAAVHTEGAWLQAPLLVAADVPSAELLRKAQPEAWLFDEVDYEATAIVGTLQAAKPHQHTAYQWFDQRAGEDGEAAPSVLALLPMQSDYVSLVWSTTHSLALMKRTDLAEQLTLATHNKLGALTPVGELKLWPLRRSVAREVVAPGLVLLGDAAHRVHPLAGQGLNLGLQDIEALARVLSEREAFRGLGDAKLLARYARERASQVSAVARLTHGLWRITQQLGKHRSGTELSALPMLRPAQAAFIWAQSSPPARALKRQLVRAAQGLY